MTDAADLETVRKAAPLAVGDMQTDATALQVTVPVAHGAASLTDALGRLAAERVAVRDAGLRRRHWMTCSSRSPGTRRPRTRTRRSTADERPPDGDRRRNDDHQAQRPEDSSRLPGPLKVVAEWNPVSTIVQGARELFGNTIPARPVPGAWPLQHAVAASLLWSLLILVVFAPLATRLYRRAVSR